MDNTSQEAEKHTGAVREDLILAAVKFLQHPNVQKSAVENKKAFLRQKGLSEKEIDVAFERSLVSLPLPAQQLPQQQQYQMGQAQHTVVPMPGYYQTLETSRWSRLRDALHSLAIVSGLIYSLYLLYKKYIAPFLFGAPKKQPAIQDAIRSLDESVKSSVQDLRADLQKVQADVEKITEQQELSRNNATSRQMQEIKNEVISLKGLLLNRKQFTSAPLERPSIPAWQLKNEDLVEQIGDGEKADEESGSGSSEAEVVTINGSDSSLELVKE